MELLDKYLQAVKFWLPSSQQADIVAELRDDIRSEVEERESGLGRSLNQSEWEALLKQRGNPLLVAEKYLPPQSLIGPLLFPPYKFVLKIVLLCYFLPSTAGWVALMFNAQYRANHLGWPVLRDLYFLFSHALAPLAIVTLVFAVLDRTKNRSRLIDNWNLAKLPRVRDTQRIPRASSGFELTAGVIFGIWWLRILWTLTVFQADGMTVRLSPMWHKFFWAFVFLWIANTTLAAVNFMRPYWTRERRIIRAVLNFATAVVLLSVVKGFAPTMAAGPMAISRDKAAVISWAVSFGLSLGFGIAGVVAMIVGFVDLWRAFKTDRAQPQLNHRVAI